MDVALFWGPEKKLRMDVGFYGNLKQIEDVC